MTDRDEPQAAQQGLERLANLTPEEIIAVILPRGHVINCFSSASNERVVQIVRSLEDAALDSSPLLGYGVDGDAEMALGRALATYIQRERDGLETIEADQYPELTEGQGTVSGHRSKFDRIVWGSDVNIFQNGGEVIIISTYGGGGGLEPLEVHAETMLEAIALLTQRYKFLSSFSHIAKGLNMLPAVTWTPKGIEVQGPFEVED